LVDVASLSDEIVGKWRAIPDLVDFIGGSEKVFVYHHSYPNNSSIGKAIATLKPGQIMLAWEGVRPPEAPMAYWTHRFTAFVRAPEELPVSSPSGYYLLIRLLFDGIPQPGTCRMREIQFLPTLDSMGGESAELSMDEQGADYFTVRFNISETTAS
jgi:hypothetical protein